MKKIGIMAGYLRYRGCYYFLSIFSSAFFNFYFLFLMRDSHVKYLLYLDFLLALATACFAGIDLCRFAKLVAKKRELLQEGVVAWEQLPEFENRDVAEHDAGVLQGKIKEMFDENCELQDYVAMCCHELKVPLATGLLLSERIVDGELNRNLREQLEKLNRQLHSMLLGCKLQSGLFDIQVREVDLRECVRTSIRNNQFFLIQKGFEVDVRVEERVYTDFSWLVYILDQLLDNAVKYATDGPRLSVWTEREDRSVTLYVEDRGEGIRDFDLGRVFEKGFTGSNYHNGRYKSTGMGLYMVDRIAGRLGHEIRVESEYGEYTRFGIVMMRAVL